MPPIIRRSPASASAASDSVPEQPRPAYEGLTQKQLEFLRVLYHNPESCFSRHTLCEKANATSTPHLLLRAIGSVNDKIRHKHEVDTKHCYGYLSLLSLGYVVAEQLDIDGLLEYNYQITPAGMAAFEASTDPEERAIDAPIKPRRRKHLFKPRQSKRDKAEVNL